MAHRLLAVVGWPAHVLNVLFAPALGRIGLSRVPAALLLGLAIGAMGVNSILATVAAYEDRPEPIPTTVRAIQDGAIDSGLWVEFDAVVVDGPHLTGVEVFAGPESTLVERAYYLVADPAEPDRAVVIRARERIAGFEPGATVRLDGSIAEDAFSMRSVLREWDPSASQPSVEFSESRFVAYAFATPWREPSFVAGTILTVIGLVLLAGAFVRQPLLRARPVAPGALGRTPLRLAIDGQLPTPRGPVTARATPGQLQWMTIEEIARVRWRYWGAALGDMRRSVESAVRDQGAAVERLVLHAATGSVIWPIERPAELRVTPGDAHVGLRRRPAIELRGDGASVVLTFDDAADRDAALAELRADGRGA
ncbi:MAG: hypothetical protein K5924_09720 [Chloroflexi bacterium]|nr:hypothetical protein [Chloroflexota bacterium]